MRSFALGTASLAVMLVLAHGAIAATTYTYDELGRLATATYDNGQRVTYSYDAAGNRTQVVAAQGSGAAQPVANPDTGTISEGTVSKLFNPLPNDTGAGLTIFNVIGADLGTSSVTNNGTRITYAPSTTRPGQDQLIYVITDSQGVSATSTLTISLTNSDPVAVNDTISIARNVPYTFDPLENDTDPGDDPLSITASTNGNKGGVTITDAGATLTYTPVQNQTGADSFTYTITDIDGASDSGTVNVTISGSNTAPVAVGDGFLVMEFYTGDPVNASGSMDIVANDTDVDLDNLTIVSGSLSQPAKGTVSTSDGKTVVYRYTAQTDITTELEDSDSFTYRVSDGQGGTSNTAIVSVTIRVNSNQ